MNNQSLIDKLSDSFLATVPRVFLPLELRQRQKGVPMLKGPYISEVETEILPCTNGRSILINIVEKISQLVSKLTLAETVEIVIHSASSTTNKTIVKKP